MKRVKVVGDNDKNTENLYCCIRIFEMTNCSKVTIASRRERGFTRNSKILGYD